MKKKNIIFPFTYSILLSVFSVACGKSSNEAPPVGPSPEPQIQAVIPSPLSTPHTPSTPPSEHEIETSRHRIRELIALPFVPTQFELQLNQAQALLNELTERNLLSNEELQPIRDHIERLNFNQARLRNAARVLSHLHRIRHNQDRAAHAPGIQAREGNLLNRISPLPVISEDGTETGSEEEDLNERDLRILRAHEETAPNHVASQATAMRTRHANLTRLQATQARLEAEQREQIAAQTQRIADLIALPLNPNLLSTQREQAQTLLDELTQARFLAPEALLPLEARIETLTQNIAQNTAATRIQSIYRGFRGRRDAALRDNREVQPEIQAQDHAEALSPALMNPIQSHSEGEGEPHDLFDSNSEERVFSPLGSPPHRPEMSETSSPLDSGEETDTHDDESVGSLEVALHASSASRTPFLRGGSPDDISHLLAGRSSPGSSRSVTPGSSQSVKSKRELMLDRDIQRFNHSNDDVALDQWITLAQQAIEENPSDSTLQSHLEEALAVQVRIDQTLEHQMTTNEHLLKDWFSFEKRNHKVHPKLKRYLTRFYRRTQQTANSTLRLPHAIEQWIHIQEEHNRTNYALPSRERNQPHPWRSQEWQKQFLEPRSNTL
jgi:hypothetical protein